MLNTFKQVVGLVYAEFSGGGEVVGCLFLTAFPHEEYGAVVPRLTEAGVELDGFGEVFYGGVGEADVGMHAAAVVAELGVGKGVGGGLGQDAVDIVGGEGRQEVVLRLAVLHAAGHVADKDAHGVGLYFYKVLIVFQLVVGAAADALDGRAAVIAEDEVVVGAGGAGLVLQGEDVFA